ncbi:MAG TPA: hypothetical protein VFZ25_03940 [Chloroflexota bacterium]|nr:hypothetical protein [Chloroflexota bacterium]
MPATNQVSKIADLVQRLEPLGAKQRGMPIEHDEWNAIVAVLQGVLEIDRAQEESAQSGLEQRFALKDHEHLGQVTVAWLDPTLQQALANGTTGVTPRIALADMQQQVTALSTQLAQLTQKLDQQQKILDQFAVNDVDRARALNGFDARFAGVENLRTLVTGINQQVDGLTANVNTVLDLRKSLSDPTGAPIDVAKIRQDVTALQTLAQNFNGVDGTPVRLRDVQLQLKEVQDVVGVGGAGGLEGRLGALSADLEGRLSKKMDDRATALHDQLATEQNTRADQLKSDLQTAIQAASDKQSQNLATAIRDSEARQNQAFTTQLTAAIAGAKTDLTVSTTALLDARLATVSDQIKTAVTTASSDLRTSLQTSLSAQLHTDLQTQVAAAETRLNGRIANDEASAQTFQTQLQASTKASIDSSVAALGTTLTASVTAQIADARTALQTKQDTDLKAASDAITASLDPKIAAGLDQRLASLGSRVTDAVNQALKTLPDQIGATVDQRLAQVDVAGQVQRSATAITQQLRTEFTQAINDLQTRTTTAINGVLTQIRGEMTVATKAAADDAVQRASTLVSALRDEVNRNLKQQIDQVRSDTTTLIKSEVNRTLPVHDVVVGGGGIHPTPGPNIVIQPGGPG